MMSGAPVLAAAAVLNLFCASPKGTDWYVIFTFGYVWLNLVMSSWNAGPSFFGSDVSHQVSSALRLAGSVV